MAEKRELNDWDRHRHQQIRDLSRTTPEQRLQALEELIELARLVKARTHDELREAAPERRSTR